MNEEQELEKKLQEKGLNAPRLNPSKIDEQIEDVQYGVFFGVLTICCIRLKNGFTVTGESACASPENFDKEVGEDVSFKNARNKIWLLEGYLLREHLWRREQHTLGNGVIVDDRLNKLFAE